MQRRAIILSQQCGDATEYQQFVYFRHMYRLVHTHFPTFLLRCKGYGV
jgi:hypothetical protein